MAKKHMRMLALFLAVFAFGSLLLVACARPGTPTASSNSSSGSPTASATSSSPSSGGSGGGSCPSGTTVKTSVSNFEQSCITLSKGATLKVVQDQTSYHILDYGQWSGSTQQPQAAPPGAPAMKDLTLSGPSVSIGPFNTAGTYHIYCTVHQGMNLTVVVK